MVAKRLGGVSAGSEHRSTEPSSRGGGPTNDASNYAAIATSTVLSRTESGAVQLLLVGSGPVGQPLDMCGIRWRTKETGRVADDHRRHEPNECVEKLVPAGLLEPARADEPHQRAIYEQLVADGCKCRLLTM